VLWRDADWWLWVFASPGETVYRVADSRGSRVVAEVLRSAFGGTLVSDCLASYDPAPYAKHKCIAHHQRAIAEARASPANPDLTYLDHWRAFFRAVTAVWKLHGEVPEAHYQSLCARLEARRDELLAQPCVQPGDIAIRNRLSKQREHLLGCLREPAAEPTNNRAERALRSSRGRPRAATAPTAAGAPGRSSPPSPPPVPSAAPISSTCSLLISGSHPPRAKRVPLT
jgi:hypothetical protein